MSAIPVNKKIRQMKGSTTEDVLGAEGLTFNRAAGAWKNMTVGPHLKPLNDDVSIPSYTTNATTVRNFRPGSQLAVYNNAGTVGSITLGNDATVTSLAVGATNSSGYVGVACKPNDWTYISSFDKRFVIASAATLLVYLIEDDTYITNENPNY
jgi:hypothetical protein